MENADGTALVDAQLFSTNAMSMEDLLTLRKYTDTGPHYNFPLECEEQLRVACQVCLRGVVDARRVHGGEFTVLADEDKDGCLHKVGLHYHKVGLVTRKSQSSNQSSWI